MRSTLILSSLVFGLAAASPLHRRQELYLDDYEDAVAAGAGSAAVAPVGDSIPEEVVSYNPTAVASDIVAAITTVLPASATADAAGSVITANAKRDAVVCTTRTFNGPQVTAPADSAAAFQAYQGFTDAATNAAKAYNIPKGYALVPGYENLKASAQDPSYLTYVSSRLTSYDTAQCAALCDAMAGCTSFVTYFERVPLLISPITQTPDKNVCPATDASASATLIKCAFYGLPIRVETATNVGQYQGSFHVVIAGANAYTRSSGPSVDGYEGPVAFGNATINAPAPVIEHGYLRTQTFGSNVPFDVSLCAASCEAQTQYNAKHGTFGGQACVFFNAYVLYKNGANGVFTCAYYGTPYGVSWAKNKGQKDGSGNVFTIGSSFGYYADGHYVE
ncbi:hypothetical protein B0T22DRAFT_235367 [Podospora appendiculata]|uniref:Uncharacterized protein n=1 Tax=Podospora appendiculata TaxID=314037 RepID=A0AAE1CAW4_9PEZI|nr:hypothetical protein B0T22DRAFT_235367 [Podospora appendiculata]